MIVISYNLQYYHSSYWHFYPASFDVSSLVAIKYVKMCHIISWQALCDLNRIKIKIGSWFNDYLAILKNNDMIIVWMWTGHHYMSIQLEKFIHPKNGTRPVDQRNVKPRTQILKFVDEWEKYIVNGYNMIYPAFRITHQNKFLFYDGIYQYLFMIQKIFFRRMSETSTQLH